MKLIISILMNNSDIAYSIMCHLNIKSCYELSCTSHFYYNAFNEDRLWIHKLCNSIDYNKRDIIWKDNYKETFKRCFNINKIIKFCKSNDALINFFIKKELNLSFNKLKTIPPSIGALVNLQNLYLNHNQLTKIPSEIGQLVNLQNLFLDYNEITEIPPSIGQLVNLRCIYIYNNNQLTTIPSEIRELIDVLLI